MKDIYSSYTNFPYNNNISWQIMAFYNIEPLIWWELTMDAGQAWAKEPHLHKYTAPSCGAVWFSKMLNEKMTCSYPRAFHKINFINN